MARTKFALPRLRPWAPPGLESFVDRVDRVFIRLEDILRQFEARAVSAAGVPQGAVTQHQGALALDAGQIVTGTFNDARVASSNVTQHAGVIDHNALLNYVAEEHVDWTAPAFPEVIDESNIPPMPQEISMQVVPPGTPVAVGDAHLFLVGANLDAYQLVGVSAAHYLAGAGTVNTEVRVERIRGGVAEDMLDDYVVIEPGETLDDGSFTVGIENDLQVVDVLRVVVEAIPDVTPPEGLVVSLEFEP